MAKDKFWHFFFHVNRLRIKKIRCHMFYHLSNDIGWYKKLTQHYNKPCSKRALSSSVTQLFWRRTYLNFQWGSCAISKCLTMEDIFTHGWFYVFNSRCLVASGRFISVENTNRDIETNLSTEEQSTDDDIDLENEQNNEVAWLEYRKRFIILFFRFDSLSYLFINHFFCIFRQNKHTTNRSLAFVEQKIFTTEITKQI